MSYKPLSIDEANPAQLRDYATKFLNLDIPEAATPEQIVGFIRAAQPASDMVFVEEADEAAEQHAEQASQATEDSGKGAVGSTGRGDPRITIRIASLDSPDGTGKADVGVGVNGVIWQLKRDVDLDVPFRVVEALGLTDQDIVRHSDEGDVQIYTSRRVQVQIVGNPPSLEEIEEWRKNTDNQFCP